MKKSALVLALVAVALVAYNGLVYEPAKKRKHAQAVAALEARQAVEAERAAAWHREQRLVEAEREAENERREAALARQIELHRAETEALKERARQYEAEAEEARARAAEAQARTAAMYRRSSNPDSAENLRAQGVNPRFFESKKPALKGYQVIETVPGQFMVVPN